MATNRAADEIAVVGLPDVLAMYSDTFEPYVFACAFDMRFERALR